MSATPGQINVAMGGGEFGRGFYTQYSEWQAQKVGFESQGKIRRLESIYTAETGYLSDPSDIVNHPAFQEIIRMGDPVVPLLLRDLEDRPRLWCGRCRTSPEPTRCRPRTEAISAR